MGHMSNLLFRVLSSSMRHKNLSELFKKYYGILVAFSDMDNIRLRYLALFTLFYVVATAARTANRIPRLRPQEHFPRVPQGATEVNNALFIDVS